MQKIKRIIPADAGSTLAAGKQLGLYADHPRGCGEHMVRKYD